MDWGWAHILLLAVAGQRLAELVYANKNTARLLARGGREAGAEHYPLFILLHGGWLAAMFAFTNGNPPVQIALLSFFVALQLARLWIISSLGPYWTTRIITLDEEPLRARGPYRFVRHPNYLLVAFEIPVLPLALDLPVLAAVFGALNVALLAYRISVEDRTLRERRELKGGI